MDQRRICICRECTSSLSDWQLAILCDLSFICLSIDELVILYQSAHPAVKRAFNELEKAGFIVTTEQPLLALRLDSLWIDSDEDLFLVCCCEKEVNRMRG